MNLSVHGVFTTIVLPFFFSSRRRHTRCSRDWSSDVCSSDLLLKDRPMTSISIRMPEDVLDDLKEIAPGLGFSGYQALIRFYIGQSLRKDLARKESGPVAIMAESLCRHRVFDGVIGGGVAGAVAQNPVTCFKAP